MLQITCIFHPQSWDFSRLSFPAVFSFSWVQIYFLFINSQTIRNPHSGCLDMADSGKSLFFLRSIRPDRPWGHPTSCTMGTMSFPGTKRPGRGVDHPPPSTAEVKERVELYLYFPSGLSWPVLGWTLPYYYYYHHHHHYNYQHNHHYRHNPGHNTQFVQLFTIAVIGSERRCRTTHF